MFVGGEECRDVRGDHRAHVGNLPDRTLVRARQPLQRAEVPRQRERGRLAHFADTEPVQQPRQRRVLALLDGRQQVGGRLLSHALELRELRQCQRIQIGGGAPPPPPPPPPPEA